eukprot:TRINITY_DN737_c0_g1_i2.p1 TRINITY_DN737_c0_g1~~TRINITY_DN737_c0_g1_i2.p1  ORF type:complete len:560 (-),score=130.81 TRINITY_DN737_c0_g1_i2:148-1827(-)
MEVKVSVKHAHNIPHLVNIITKPKLLAEGLINCHQVFQTPAVATVADYPIWNVSFTINVWNLSEKLVVNVVEDPWGPGRFVKGTVSIPLHDIANAKKVEKEYPLSPHGRINLAFVVTKAPPKKTRVGIIGSGISGASCAYFLTESLHNLGTETEITVFEKDATVGGRVGTFQMGGETIEQGGSILMDTGVAYFKHFVEKFKLETEAPFDSSAPLGIWDGKKFVLRQNNSIILLLLDMINDYRLSLKTLFDLNKDYVGRYNSLYPFLDDHQTFNTGYDMLQKVNLADMTEITMRAFCDEHKIQEELYQELLTGICRSNNGLSPDLLTAYVGILCMTLDPRKIYSVKGGNVLVIQKLLEAAKAVVKTNTQVTEVIKNQCGTYTVKYGNSSAEFDSIIVATQLHYANQIKWTNVTLPPAFTTNRKYHTMHEAWAICEVNDEHFKVKGPGNIMTTNNPDIPFASMMTLKTYPNGKILANAKSTTPLTPESIKIIWKNIEQSHFKSWTPAFPATVPIKKEEWPSTRVADKVYLSNILEPAFSNIESSIMSAKNASNVLIRDLMK